MALKYLGIWYVALSPVNIRGVVATVYDVLAFKGRHV